MTAERNPDMAKKHAAVDKRPRRLPTCGGQAAEHRHKGGQIGAAVLRRRGDKLGQLHGSGKAQRAKAEHREDLHIGAVRVPGQQAQQPRQQQITGGLRRKVQCGLQTLGGPGTDSVT